MDKYTYIANSDAAYIDELYNSYKQDPASVDAGWQKFFEGYEFFQKYPVNGNGHTNGAANGKETATISKTDPSRIRKEMEVVHLIRGYRSRGHLMATTNPIQKRKDRQPQLDIADFNLGPEDMETVFEAGVEVFGRPATLREIVDSLKTIYTKKYWFRISLHSGSRTKKLASQKD